MDYFNFKNYCGEIKEVSNGRTSYKFLYADLNDAEQIARIYSEISVNEKNYNIKLDPENKKNFEHTGGMFIIHTKESIKSEMKSGKSFFAVIKNSGNEIVASLWVSKSDPNFADFNVLNYVSLTYTPEKTPNEENILFPREIIINPKYRFSGISKILCYTIFSAAYKNGQKWALGEVYKVCSYSIGETAKEVGMLNQGGYEAITGMGGRFIGTFPPRDIQIKSLRVIIESQIFILNLEETLTILENYINNSGLVVCREL